MRQKIIYPVQPFFVINSMEYYKKYSIHPAIAHFYKFTGNQNSHDCCAVPDGAIDIIFRCNKGKVTSSIYGTVSQGMCANFENDQTYFGVRLMPGFFDYIGDASASELMKGDCCLEDVFQGECLSEQIAQETDFQKQTDIFEKSFIRKSGQINDSSHAIVGAILHEIYANDGVVQVKELEDCLGYSRRHLSRCFDQATGMDIKTFTNYVRFQSVLKKINRGEFSSLADAVAAGNYYDQAHFQKSFKRFANTTPGAYLKLLQKIDYWDMLTVF